MADSRELDVADELAWGKLVKTWATGMNYVDGKKTEPAPADYAWPKTLAELAAQCTKAKVGLRWRDGKPVTGKEPLPLVVFQQSSAMVVLKLPAADMLKASEDALAKGGAYPLPNFYDKMFASVDENGKPTTRDAKRKTLKKDALLDTHAMRIGDYVLRICH